MAIRTAFVVDALAGMGGGERVILKALELFPEAPVFAMVYHPAAFARTLLAQRRVVASFVNWMPFASTYYRWYLPLMLPAVQGLNLSGYDQVISFSYAVAHGASCQPGQRHLSYTFTPLRYAWRSFPLFRPDSPAGRLAQVFLQRFRRWDTRVAARVDRFAAVSGDIAALVRQVYDRPAQVIYPPVDVQRFRPQARRDDFYITVARLVPHKRIELIIEAVTRLGLRLIVVGDGPERARLLRMATSNIQFAGLLPDPQVANLLERARGFISAAEEDFGIAMVEAQAAGCPVIAYGKGGALETVIDQQTGLFFNAQTADSLVDALERFEYQLDCFEPQTLVLNAGQFSADRFLEEFGRFAA